MLFSHYFISIAPLWAASTKKDAQSQKDVTNQNQSQAQQTRYPDKPQHETSSDESQHDLPFLLPYTLSIAPKAKLSTKKILQ
jgi:hypothetical protein